MVFRAKVVSRSYRDVLCKIELAYSFLGVSKDYSDIDGLNSRIRCIDNLKYTIHIVLELLVPASTTYRSYWEVCIQFLVSVDWPKVAEKYTGR